jgi:hypothetical protein
MCFRLIDAKRAQHPVSLLCSVLGDLTRRLLRLEGPPGLVAPAAR